MMPPPGMPPGGAPMMRKAGGRTHHGREHHQSGGVSTPQSVQGMPVPPYILQPGQMQVGSNPQTGAIQTQKRGGRSAGTARDGEEFAHMRGSGKGSRGRPSMTAGQGSGEGRIEQSRALEYCDGGRS